ncbi:uncharacterized protein LOC135115854 isoform X2 [Scylla paramamosain]|uniref:uncharacterized protein LOC135115854 isoform X2 n=1 Tax=Scylla paramamosain TaxID=85552 RepID=UPI0030832AA1
MGIDAMLRASTPHKSQDLASEGASAECSVEVRGGGQAVGVGGQQVGSARRMPDPVEVSSVTYLSVPETPVSRRPSTADLVIEKLQVEKVEGGGLSIQGVSLASNCHVTLCVFGVFFMLAGVVLSYISYSVTLGADEEGSEGKEKGPEEHLASVSQMRMIGPAFLVVGFLMVGLGITLFVLARKISRDEKAKQLVISEQQLCELESSFSYSAASPMHTAYPAPNQPYPILAVRRNSWWVDSMPKDAATSAEAQDSAVQCPSPIEESVGGTPTRILTPVPLELLPDLSDPIADIACFPPSSTQTGFSPDAQSPPPSRDDGDMDKEANLMEVRSDIPTLFTAAQEIRPSSTLSRIPSGEAAPPRLTNGQDMRGGMLKPSSAAQSRSHGVSVPSSAGQIPSIQVTAATPVLPPLPRLSRHHSSRPDSRPTTADSR